MPAGIKANPDGSAAIQVGGTDVITLTSGGAATFVTSPTTVQAGTAAAPSITTSGDTNTGIFFPAADTIAFAEGGVESMRIDSAGNVGIGTSSPTQPLSIRNAGSAYLDVAGGNRTLGTNSFTVGQASDGVVAFFQRENAAMYWATNSTERARISAAGELLVGSPTDQGAYNIQCNGTGVWGAAAYVNGSDERIKEDIAPITSGLDVVTQMNPVTYRYKESWSKDQSIQTGFIAQELLVAMEGKNYVDGVVQQGGSEGYYSVAYQNIIPLLTKAIQEQQAMIDELKAKVAALEGA